MSPAKRGGRQPGPSGAGRGRPGARGGGSGRGANGRTGSGRGAGPGGTGRSGGGRGGGGRRADGAAPRFGPDRAGARRSAGSPRPSSPAGRALGGDQVEGRQAVRELLMAGRRKVHEIWLANDLDPAPILDEIIELATDDRIQIREVSRTKLDYEARTDAPQGVLAHAVPLQPVELDGLARPVVGRPAPFLLALDGVTDPGNLGALLRSAECAGVTGVILPRHRAAHVTASVTKAAAGAVEHLPMALVSGIPTALVRLRELGVWSVGLDAAADRTLWELDVAAEPVVLVLGAEGTGLSRLVRERCDQVVAIPLAGRVEALNVATAGALACYEVVRRRGSR